MAKRKFIINIIFNTFRWNEHRLEKDWIDDRIDKFMNFTLCSLKLQTNQDFVALVQYEPLSEENVQKALQKYDKLPENVRFVTPKGNPILKHLEGYDILYLIRLDSDDAYHKSFIQQLHDYQPREKTKVIINQKGYLYDSTQNRLAYVFYESPQFYTFIYKVPEYLDGKKYLLSGGHAGAIALDHEIQDKRNFLNIVHSSNVLKTPKHLNHKNIIQNPEEVNTIVKQFLGKTVFGV